MDEQQGRVGREDALQANGEALPAGGATVREITSFAAIPFQIRNEFADRPSAACGGLAEERFAGLGGFEANTGNETFLIGLPCGAGDADNQPYAFWERKGSRFRSVALPVMTGDGPSTAEEAWNIGWDQDSAAAYRLFQGARERRLRRIQPLGLARGLRAVCLRAGRGAGQ